ncbi:M20 family metallopeptidase [Microbacterium sp.]|uniref:M20 family metallopeptidase n=1 Tax=Microbacterium sp. TaxID=51671 RepID=UPI00281189AF|nr:ArgE/DapE family deacylase [Microbacterium sp.]
MTTTAVTTERMVEMLVSLLETPSAMPEGDTTAVCEVIAAHLADAGYDPVISRAQDGPSNVVARIGSGSPEVVLCTHIDTVGPGTAENWTVDPFAGTVKDGRVYGLGAENCKGAAAIMLELARTVMEKGGPRQGSIVFAFVGDEENLSDGGAKHLRDAGIVTPDVLVISGPSGFDLGCEERGVVWVAVDVYGEAFHAGSPGRGDNALLRATRLVHGLESVLQPRLAERRDALFESTMAITTFRSGQDINTVPDWARFELDRRILPSEEAEDVIEEIREVLSSLGEPEGTWVLEPLVLSNGFEPGRDGPGVQAHVQAVQDVLGYTPGFLVSEGASDGRHFARDGIEILNFGAGLGERCHAPDEYIELAHLSEGYAVQLRALEIIAGGWRDEG